MISSLRQIMCKGKRVFLRADCNVSAHDLQAGYNLRLEGLIPTLEFILQQQGKVIIATHRGRPEAHSRINPADDELSTHALIPWFEDRGLRIDYEPDMMHAIERSHHHNGEILLIENMRFFMGECECDYDFAQLLAQLADVYINDAFGLIHRSDTSVTLVAEQFPSKRRGVGLLMERELQALELVRSRPVRPYYWILGGVKIKDKLQSALKIITGSEHRRPDAILLGGGVAREVCRVMYQGDVRDEHNVLDEMVRDFITSCRGNNVELVLPTDYLVRAGELCEVVLADNVADRCADIVDIGPATIEHFSDHMRRAKMIVSNGPMGKYEELDFARGTTALFEALQASAAYVVVGGGDTTSGVLAHGFRASNMFLSTGGGAMLAYLASDDPCRDLAALRVLSM